MLVVVPIRKLVVAATTLGAAVALIVRLTPAVLSAALVGVGGAVVAASGWVRRQFQRPVAACGVCST